MRNDVNSYVDWALKGLIVFVGSIGLHFLYGIDSKLGTIQSQADRASQDIKYIQEDIKEIKVKDDRQDHLLADHERILFTLPKEIRLKHEKAD